MPGLETLVMVGGELVGGGTTTSPGTTSPGGETTETVETRKSWEWPFAGSSLWNTPIGSGVTHTGLAHEQAVNLRSVKGQLNYTSFSTPVNIADAAGTPLTLREVNAGTWSPSQAEHTVARAPATVHLSGDMVTASPIYNNDGTITFSNIPDGVMALFDTVDQTVTEMYKAVWDKDASTSGTRRLIGRKGTVDVYDLLGDGWTTRGSRASTMSFTAGLIRKWELAKAATDPEFAIRHALAVAINNTQLLDPDVDTYATPGYQWPARAFDANARSAYSGKVRMGTHIMLDPAFDIEGSTLSNEGKALAYALRNFGAYVVDRSTYVSLYLEEYASSNAAADRMKADWQAPLLANMVIITNNNSTDVGGPGTRLRPPAPAFA